MGFAIAHKLATAPGLTLHVQPTAANSLRKAAEAFLMDRKASSYTKATITHYQRTFDRFIPWLEQNEPGVSDVSQVTDKAIIRWITELQESGLAARTNYG